MKPFAIVLLVFCAAVGAAGAAALAVLVVTPTPLEATAEPVAPAPAYPAPAGEAAEVATLRGEVQMLAQRIVDLERELSVMREQATRRPVPTPDETARAARAATAPGAEFSEEERVAIASILEQAREDERAKREEERLQREEEQILARAERIATEIGLSPGDQKALTDHMLVAAVKRREILEMARQDDFDREQMRDQFLELRDWSEKTLMNTFGADLATQIQEVERTSRGGDRVFGRDGGRGDSNRRDEGGGRGGRGSG